MHGGGGFSGGGHHGGGFSGHHHGGGLGHHGHHGNHHHHTGDSQGFVGMPLFLRRGSAGRPTGVDPKRVLLALGVVMVVGIVVGMLAAH
ncbi:hypothetical protein SNA_20845 [Streptomyces natalensis ATCC 27448]|uniref:Uncharacterized protein n=1 Tax=Streptomyces natalensis ATCC 27448 TaxID=1240678 RepID=A0A0D7CIW0_9ACTN|nr:hypothetical protein SNA_20845 [Streptomyces natalensis ATCC 27448]